jgi:glycosyltransferase involved in cell wall biosynthesis
MAMEIAGKNVLILTDYFFPGYKAGGPIQSIHNLIEKLGGQINFKIITSDRDLGDETAYQSVTADKWIPIDNSFVFYASTKKFRIRPLIKIIREANCDIIYFNSLFSRNTIRALVFLKLGIVKFERVLLAPRGELSPGALIIRKSRKKTFLLATNFLKLYSNVTWHASTKFEYDDICRSISPGAQQKPLKIIIAQNIPAYAPLQEGYAVNSARKKMPEFLNIVFLSRISRKKNLHYALTILKELAGNIQFDIYGPIEDEAYWSECKNIIDQMPENIRVQHKGSIHHSQVNDIFSRYHLFLFPTLAENYGHVIIEALQAGCPILISDQTPWHGLSDFMAGWDISLARPQLFKQKIQEMVLLDESKFRLISQNAMKFAYHITNSADNIDANKKLFFVD